ncbi:hypothetical protein MCOL2_00640 [Listeria fleischmannii FSL S10-1203]|uniref:Uncharacterized protein n=1 Tax=Listeria fleischmannii FSL S10-1203 TaxID=1265822 RepID=W7DR25_9LIST|nr:hypothetical protein MCOL2_00640 [Listeria fleischmannii FSL S10-1203]
MLAQISDIQKMYDLSDAYFTRSYQDDKTLIITPYLAEELLEKLAFKKASLQIFSEQNEVFNALSYYSNCEERPRFPLYFQKYF